MDELKYEYLIKTRDNKEKNHSDMSMAEYLNIFGNEGWELVAVDGNPNYAHYYFKRLKKSS